MVLTPIGSLGFTYLLSGESTWGTADEIKAAAVIAPLGILTFTASAAMLEGLVTVMVLAYRVNEKLKADFKAEQERRKQEREQERQRWEQEREQERQRWEQERKERIEALKQEAIQEFIQAASGEVPEEVLERIMKRWQESQNP